MSGAASPGDASGLGGAGDAPGDEVGPSLLDRRLPPVAELLVTSVALMLAGGVYLAAHLPVPPPLGPAVALVAAGGAATLGALVMLVRIRPFAWSTFSSVWRWAMLAYLVIAAVLAFVFIYDHTRGTTLVVLIATLAVFALDVPTIIAFTAARYDDASRPAEH